MSLKGGQVSVLDCFVLFSFAFRWYQSLCIGVCSWPKSFLVRRPFAFVALFRLFCVFVTCWIFFASFPFSRFSFVFFSSWNFLCHSKISSQVFLSRSSFVLIGLSWWLPLPACEQRISSKVLELFKRICDFLAFWKICKRMYKKHLLMMGATAPASFCSRGAWLLTRSRESDRDRYSSYL